MEVYARQGPNSEIASFYNLFDSKETRAHLEAPLLLGLPVDSGAAALWANICRGAGRALLGSTCGT